MQPYFQPDAAGGTAVRPTLGDPGATPFLPADVNADMAAIFRPLPPLSDHPPVITPSRRSQRRRLPTGPLLAVAIILAVAAGFVAGVLTHHQVMNAPTAAPPQ